MLKAKFLAKGRKYSGMINSTLVRRFPDQSEGVSSSNSNRVHAPHVLQMPAPASEPVTSITSLVVDSQKKLLKNYQLELQRNEASITKQRLQIKKLLERNANMVDVLRKNHDEVARLEKEIQALKVNLCFTFL